MEKLVGRDQELALLRLELERRRPSLVMVYGPRRVGKTALLMRALKGQKVIYYCGQRLAPSSNLSLFKNTVTESLGNGVRIEPDADWDSVFGAIQQFALRAPRPITLVLDEFGDLCTAHSALSTTVGRVWERIRAAAPPFNLILCGSRVGFMQRLAGSGGPFRTRPSLELLLEPLSYLQAAGFFPDWPIEDRLAAYGVFGGLPYYLRLCDPDVSLRDNVIGLVMDPYGPLHDEPNHVLEAELQNLARYSSVLHAMGSGCREWRQIARKVPELGDGGALGVYLKKLEELRLIRVLRSLDSARRARNRRYALSDPFLQFWYRFVLPNSSALQAGAARQVFTKRVAPFLDDHMSGIFSGICREYLRMTGEAVFGSAPREVGEIWGNGLAIPVAARLSDGSSLVGECNWLSGPAAATTLAGLKEKAEKTTLVKSLGRCRFVIFARDGFTEDLIRDAATQPGVRLLGPAELLGEA